MRFRRDNYVGKHRTCPTLCIFHSEEKGNMRKLRKVTEKETDQPDTSMLSKNYKSEERRALLNSPDITALTAEIFAPTPRFAAFNDPIPK